MELFGRFKKKPRNEQGVQCDKSVLECGLGNMAIRYGGAVWYGGRCGDCGEFKQGAFIGNDVHMIKGEDGQFEEIPKDEALIAAEEAGVDIRPFNDCPLQLRES